MRPETEPTIPAARRASPWPIAIVVGLLLVAVWNIAYVYVAVSGADPVDPSYVTEPR